jgi:hypothetical protein
MFGDVDHGAVRIAHEEPPQAPLLVGGRVDDLRSRGDGTLVEENPVEAVAAAEAIEGS